MTLGRVTRNASDPPMFWSIRGRVPAGQEEDFWQYRIFPVSEAYVSKPFSRKKSWWKRALAAICSPYFGVKQWLLSRDLIVFRTNIKGLLHRITDRHIVGARFSSQVWEVAFHHVYMVCPKGGLCDTDLDANLETSLSKHIGRVLEGYHDPSEPVGVRCMTSPFLSQDRERDIILYLGRAVFAPRRSEKPIGWVRYYSDPSSEPNQYEEPRFLDGTLAAIYRGQRAVGIDFSGQPGPVLLSMGLPADSSGAMAYIFGRDEVSENSALALDLNIGPGSTGTIGGRVRKVPSEGSVDQSWDINFFRFAPAIKRGRLDVCLDARLSRLHYKKPSAGAAQISGIRFKVDDFDEPIIKAWLNFDSERNLLFSAMQKRHFSFSWDFKNRMAYFYDWRDKWPRNAKDFNLRLDLSEDGREVTFRRQNEGDFGYLVLPDDPTPVIFRDELQNTTGYHVDWLDYAGTVQIQEDRLGIGEGVQRYSGGRLKICQNDMNETEEIAVGPLLLRKVQR